MNPDDRTTGPDAGAARRRDEAPAQSAEPVALRLPAPALRRQFVRHAAVVALALGLLVLLAERGSWAAALGAVAVALATLAVGYGFSARRVWLSVTPGGLSTVGYTGRRVEVGWHEPAQLRRARRGGQRGWMLTPVARAGGPFAAIHGVFVPAAIADGAEFQRLVAHHAPAGHALRALG